MGFLKNILHGAVLGSLVLSVVIVLNVFEADMFTELFCTLGLIIWGILWFFEISLMRL